MGNENSNRREKNQFKRDWVKAKRDGDMEGEEEGQRNQIVKDGRDAQKNAKRKKTS